MLENLFNLIKEQGVDSVINNPVVPNEQNNAVLVSATHSVAEEMQGTLAGGGGLQSLLSLFGASGSSGGAGSLLNNPMVSSIINNFTQKLSRDHGISGDQANGIANNLMPGVIGNLISKTNDPNDSSFDLNGIISSLTGGSGFDLNSMLSKFSNGGMDSDGDGKLELSDIVSKVTGNA